MLGLAWLIPLFPLAAFALITFGLWRSRRASAWAAIGGIALSLALSLAITPQVLARSQPFEQNVPWLPFGLGEIQFGVLLDPMAAVMLVTVTIVCTLIFIYSQGYMAEDPRYARFFAYISLFATGMLGVVVSSNLLMFFVFWEIMGLCSYLLISFWYEKPQAARAGIKAFVVTRLGDLSLLLGLVLLFTRTGSLLFTHNFQAVEELAQADPGFVTLVALLIFGGAIGKSAQFPLHVWLPDAMEGPTPVSALIHAATMVAAGVYLIARNFPILEAATSGGLNPTLVAVGYIGAFSALFAATIAVAQSDIKRVLAYSTISQLGYMVLAVGVAAPAAAIFHLMTHAFFKALLFLGAGSVIHAMHTNDMFRMGGLRRHMPTTYWTMGVGALALAGIFPLAGFWSKDEILAASFRQDPALWVMAALAVLFTGFYSARLMGLTFFGELRDKEAHPHESPPVMAWPLRILAVLAALAGLAVAVLPFLGGPALAELLEPGVEHHGLDVGLAAVSLVIALVGLYLGYRVYVRQPLRAGRPDPLRRRLGSLYVLLESKYYVDELYQAVFVRPAYRLARWLYDFDNRWVIDPMVEGVARVTERISFGNRRFDRAVVDGGANLVADLTRVSGRVLRVFQSGQVQNYMLLLLAGLLVLVAVPYLPAAAFWAAVAFAVTVILVAALDLLLRARREEEGP